MKWNTIISERTKLISLILIILALGGVIFYALICVFEHMQNWWRLWLAGILVYIILLEVINTIKKHTKLKGLQIIETGLLTPIIVLKLILDIAKPTVYIFTSVLYTVVTAFLLPFSILKGLNIYFLWNLNLSTMIFAIFAFGSILCVHQSKILQSCICSLPPLNRDEHNFQKLGRDLSLYILHPKNVSFILYLLYFVYLAVSGFMQLQYNGYFINKEIDGAILKAFLLFIAYTNMIVKSREVNVQAKDLLIRIVSLINAKDE